MATALLNWNTSASRQWVVALAQQTWAHITWSGLTAGFEMFVGRVGQNLSSIEITLLDNYSWASIVSIGETYFYLPI